MTKFISALALLLLFVANVLASDRELKSAIEKADVLEAQQNFEGVINVLRPHADQNDAGVEWRLANAYLYLAINGKKEVDAEDIAPAIRYAKKSADHGSGGGMNLLYLIYANGWGVSVDTVKAADFLRRAVAAGDMGAKLNYAVSLYQGTPVIAKDVDKACGLFEELMKGDSADALAAYYLGVATFRGQCGRKADRKKGMEMVRLAAEHGIRDAERDMGKSLEQGWIEEPNLVQALSWYEKAAEHGDPHSQWRIGLAYVDGRAWPKDVRMAVESFRRAADSGYSNGMTSLAVMYAAGDGVEQDFSQALALYEQAAALGNAHAYRGLAVMHALGQGVPTNPALAYELYKKAVEMGNPEDPALRQAIEEMLDSSE